MPAGGPHPVVGVDARKHIYVREAPAIGEAVLEPAARQSGPSPQETEPAAFGLNLPVHRRATGVSHHVDRATHRITAVERGARAAQDLDPTGIDEIEIRNKGAGVTLGRGGIAKAETVDENGGGVGAQTAHADLGKLADSAGVANLDAGSAAEDLGQREFVAGVNLVGADDGDGLGGLVNALGCPGVRDGDGPAEAGDLELEVLLASGVAQPHRTREAAESLRVHPHQDGAGGE